MKYTRKERGLYNKGSLKQGLTSTKDLITEHPQKQETLP